MTQAKRILSIHAQAIKHFNAGDWRFVALVTESPEIVDDHPRLLRSLSFGDDDYEGCALQVISQMAKQNENALDEIEQYIANRYPPEGEFVSSAPAARVITFAPNAFHVPDDALDSSLVAVMMPFDAGFNQVYQAIKGAATDRSLQCVRADDLWQHTTIIQEIFALIFRARIVVVDFTGKNPNVMYETGIAHTLGKHVVPISQSMDDVPFDIRHHRVLKYLPNSEGMAKLRKALASRLGALQ